MQSSRILQNFPLRKTPQRGPTVHPGAPLHGNLKGELRALKEAMEAMEAMQAEDSASKSGRKKKKHCTDGYGNFRFCMIVRFQKMFSSDSVLRA